MLLLIPGLIVAIVLSVLAYLLSRDKGILVTLTIYTVTGIAGIKLTSWVSSAILGVVFYSYITIASTVIVFDRLMRWIYNKLLGGRSHAGHDRHNA